jgi:hypothetical protein
VDWLVMIRRRTLVFALDDDSVHECRPGANECDQVGCVNAAPALLRYRQQLVGYCQTGRSTPSSCRPARAQFDRGEDGLDGVRIPQVNPVLGWEVEIGGQERRVANEVAKIVEPTIGIVLRPLV